VFDQATKYVAQAYLTLGETVPVISGVFQLTLVYNSGIAFGLLHNQVQVLIVLISVSILILLFIGHRLWLMSPSSEDSSALSRWGIVLILGGAVGNWIDRVRLNAVVDFLDFRVWPVFNLADSAITVGVGLFVILFLKKAGHKT